MKICSVCKKEKQEEYFPKRADRKSGLQSSCKDCKNQKAHEYRNRIEIKTRINANQNTIEYKRKHAQWVLNNYRTNEDSRIKQKSRKLLKTYNITLEQYNNLLIQQNHKCSICRNR